MDLLCRAGIEVITDSKEAQRVLDEANGDARMQAMIGGLQKASDFIMSFLKGKTKQRSSKLEIPERANRLAEMAIGHKIKSHTINANELTHSKKRHGINGSAITEKNIPLRDEDFALMPYIMSAPTRVVKGSMSSNGTESVRYEKELSNGIVVVVEREGRFDVEDMENITMWAEKKSATNVTVAQRASHSTSETIVISEADAVKIRKDAEAAIRNDEKLRQQKVYHGSGADFEAFDHSHMGEGEGAQSYGWGTYVTEVEGIGRTYAMANNNSLRRSRLESGIRRLKEALPFRRGDAKREGEEELKRLEEELSRFDESWKSVLYTVEIPDDNGGNYITWNKGLPKSQRKKIADHLRTLPDSLLDTQRQVHGSNWLPNGWNTIANVIENNPTWGKDIVERLKDALGSSKEASMTLSDVGFVGISYPAQYRSSGRNDGAKNYVIFNESDMKITDKARFLRTKDGVAYGFTIGGKIYIDTSIAKADTPIHEYTHLWASALRESNPKEWANVVSLMKGTPIWDSVRQNYPELTTDDEIADEVLAHYSGKRGAEQLREAQRKAAEESGSVMASANAVSTIERVRKALSKFWEGVADLLNIHFTTAEEVADRVLYDLLRGYKPQSKAVSNVRLQKTESEEGDLLFRQRDVEAEMAQIVADAKANGTYMKAPNGKRSKLTPRQWALVRTKAFKKWFGDWEKVSRIDKLRKSENVSITGKEIEPSEDLKQYKKNALEYGKTLRGEYTNKDTGETISLTGGNKRGGIREILQHDYKDVPHLRSIAAIPQIIENAVFIDELPNNDVEKYAGVKFM